MSAPRRTKFTDAENQAFLEFMRAIDREDEELRRLPVEERRRCLEVRKKAEREQQRKEQEEARERECVRLAMISQIHRASLTAKIREARARFAQEHGENLPVDDGYKIRLAASMGIVTKEMPSEVEWLSETDSDEKWGMAFDDWREDSDREEREWLAAFERESG